MLATGGGAEGPVPTGLEGKAAQSGGGGSATPNQPSPFANEDWSGGDVSHGKQVFLNNCARCHGPDGKGGNKPGIGVVPTLRDPGWHERTTVKMLASHIAHGKGVMPGPAPAPGPAAPAPPAPAPDKPQAPPAGY
jgi:mono/diheme cytochrome c family protein